MRKWPDRANGNCTGFSLLEVLIASTMFSLAMAGLSALLLTNLSSSAQSRKTSVASVAAANLAEQIRLNSLAIDRYLNPPDTVSKDCQNSGSGSGSGSGAGSGSGMASAGVVCTPQQQADYDFGSWQLELSEQLPHSAATVCMDNTPEDGDVVDEQCDGGGPLVIKIFWATPPDANNQSINKHRYTLVAG